MIACLPSRMTVIDSYNVLKVSQNSHTGNRINSENNFLTVLIQYQDIYNYYMRVFFILMINTVIISWFMHVINFAFIVRMPHI